VLAYGRTVIWRQAVPAIGLSLAVLLVAPPLGTAAGTAPRGRAAVRHIAYHQWSSTRALRSGRLHGTVARHGGLSIGAPVGMLRYVDPFGSGTALRYDVGRWVSPWTSPGFGLTQLVASWNARTPYGTWIGVEVRGRTTRGRLGSWDTLARWASHDRRFHRMSLPAQRDDVAKVDVDTLVTAPGVRLASWQLRLSLYRRTGTSATPTVASAGAMSSRLPPKRTIRRSRPGVARGVSLRVPRLSQMIHRGEYPRWDGGGEAWCSPTSTAMLLAYWRRGPTPRQYAWVDPAYRQPQVDYAARYVFDYAYRGAGNWPFNTAYAAGFRLEAFVTRLRSLRQAERFITAGIPLAASIAFGPGQLDGAPIRSTSGHLLVITGFTRTGDVVVNDPAAASARGVRRVYRRGQFERAWLAGSGGTVYVVHPPGVALPAPAANW
jgi:peptidase C39-like protein